MRQFLEHVTGLSIYPLFSFVFFGLFFIGVLIQVFLMSRNQVAELSNLPFEENNPLGTAGEKKSL